MKLIIIAAAASTTAAQTSSFQGIGHLPASVLESAAYGISADGNVVVGTAISNASNEAVRWTHAAGLQPLQTTPGAWNSTRATAASADGSAIIGNRPDSPSRAFRWTAATGMVDLGDLPGGNVGATAWGVSANGQIVVGYSDAGVGSWTAFRWTPGAGMHTFLPVLSTTLASAISADGLTIAGVSSQWGYRWSAQTGMQIVEVGLTPYALSADGSVVAGSFTPCGAFRWTAAGGIECLGKIPGSTYAQVNALSADGDIAIGTSFTAPPTSGPHRAFIWDDKHGLRDLRTVLQEDYNLDLTGWQLNEGNGISADGTVIVGAGVNPCLQKEGWVARLGMPACPPDCNADDVLTVSDFGCFQTRFVTQDRYADCNRDCQFTVADFGCFQTAFVAGCD